MKKSELKPTQDLEFLGYHFNLREGLVYPNQKKLDKLKILMVSILQGHTTTPRKLMSLIGVMASMEKTIPLGQIHMRPFQWFLKTNWHFPQSLDKIVPISQLIKVHLAWWMDPQMCSRVRICIRKNTICCCSQMYQRRVGGSLQKLYYKWGLAAIRKRLAYQYFIAESCFSGSETFSRTIKTKNRVGFFRQFNCGLISTRKEALTPSKCVQTYSRESQYDSRFPILEGQGHSDRMVSAPSGFSRNLPSLAQANGGSVCNQLECQTANLRISCPRRQGLAGRCVEHLFGGSGCLWLLSSGHPAPVSSEDGHLQVQGCCYCTRVAGDALVLGSGGVVNQDSTEASSSTQSPKATLQSQIPQESGLSESPCVVSGHLQEGQGRFSVDVADRIKAPQRESSRRVYDSR